MQLTAGLAWRAWPLRQRPVLGAFAAFVGIGTVAGVWSWTGSMAMCLLASAILLVYVGPFFVPTRYRLDPDGVEVRRLFVARHRSWAEFGAIRGGPETIVLSPLRWPAWLPGREETLFLEGNGDEVRAYVEKMVGAPSGAGRG